jgi:DNA polymerase III gamma/tau subunit
MALTPKSAWFERYRPQDIENMVWPNEGDKRIVQGWFDANKIDGNILLSGSAGTGKTTLAEILIRHFIKANNDLFRMKSRSVKEIDDELRPFVIKQPVRSPFKIVYIEEFDRISSAAEAELKEGLMEKYIDHCIYIACTNHPQKIENAVLTRFIYKFDFNTVSDVDAITQRIIHILKTEGLTPDEAKLKEFISEHYNLGLRELINLFQTNYNANSKTINYEGLKASAQFDENIVKLLLEIIETVMGINDSKTRKMCATRPTTTLISDKYTQFVTVVMNNSFEINFNYIFERMYETIHFLPLRHIIGRYAQTLDGKKFPQYHLESCLKEMLDCCAEAML